MVLIEGSASSAVEAGLLVRAHSFAREVVRALWSCGCGFVVVASGEPLRSEDPKIPLIFSWTIVEEIVRLAGAESERSRSAGRLVIIAARKHFEANVPAHRLAMLRELETNAIAVIELIPDELWVGGRFRERQADLGSGLICIGGGKGVSDLARRMQDKKAPVLPFDFDIGSICNDGEGAVGLYRALIANPERFFPRTADAARRNIFTLTLQGPSVDLPRIATLACDMICDEQREADKAKPIDVLFVTALAVELEALRIALGLGDQIQVRTPSGTKVNRAGLKTRHSGDVVIGACCLGAAGNVGASSVVSELLRELAPRLVVMVGIAAGMRGKRRLGEVVFAEEVVAYEPGTLVENEGGQPFQARPRTFSTSHVVQQDVIGYIGSAESAYSRISQALERQEITFPESEGSSDVAVGPSLSLATIGSGEKLIRDSVVWTRLRAIHGRVDVAEMEAAGVAQACQQHSVPFLVIRGIADFGDSKKDDRYHRIASASASAVAVDFVREALSLRR